MTYWFNVSAIVNYPDDREEDITAQMVDDAGVAVSSIIARHPDATSYTFVVTRHKVIED